MSLIPRSEAPVFIRTTSRSRATSRAPAPRNADARAAGGSAPPRASLGAGRGEELANRSEVEGVGDLDDDVGRAGVHERLRVGDLRRLDQDRALDRAGIAPSLTA